MLLKVAASKLAPLAVVIGWVVCEAKNRFMSRIPNVHFMSHLGKEGEFAAVVIEVDDVESEPAVQGGRRSVRTLAAHGSRYR